MFNTFSARALATRALLTQLVLTPLVPTRPAVADTALPPIMISATRSELPGIDIPAARTLIDAEQIADSGAHDISELLHRTVGLHVSDGIGDGSSSRIDMRGFGSTAQSNVAVLINGRKINPATDGATLYLNSIDLDSIERIEVIEGSAGTLYGNQAVGGLINIVTRRPRTATRELSVGGGSYAARALSASLSEPLAFGTVLQLNLHHDASDNYRDHNASRVTRIGGRIDVDHAGGASYIDFERLDDYVQTPGALFADELAADRRQAVFTDDFLDTVSTVVRVGTRTPLSAHWQFEGELAWRDDARDFVQSFRGFPGGLSTQDRESVELTPRLIATFDDSVVTLGVDLLHTDYLLQTAFGPQGDEQDIAAAYAQLTQPLTPALSVTAGVRHARVDNAINNSSSPVSVGDSVTVGSLGAVYRPDPAWRLFLRADQNYRFAKVDEHTNVPFGQPVGLDTQRGISYETGAEYTGAGLRASLRAYRLELQDEISFDAVTFTNVNLDRSRRRGVTLSLDTALTRTLDAGVGYAFIDSEITSGTHRGSQVPLVPRRRATAYAEYRPADGWLARVDVEHVDRQFLGSDFANAAPPLDAYTVVDLVVHRDIAAWRFTLKVNNLLDARYSETGASSFAGDGYNPAPERNLWLGARYTVED